MPSFRILPAGDAALVVELPERIDPGAERLVRRPGATRSRPASAPVVARCRDRLLLGHRLLRSADASTRRGSRREVRARAERLDVATVTEGPLVDVPVCYGGDLGPDLADVAAFAVARRADVIAAAHRPRVSRLHGRLRSRLRLHGRGRTEDRRAAASHRRGRPCRRVRSRSPADRPASIRPSTPGGWNIIGRTPIRPYDPDRGRSRFCSSPATACGFVPCQSTSSSSRDARPSPSFAPGMLTTVQDLGRWGFQANGVPVAGPMDEYSHVLANRLVGNPPSAAALEVTLIGPELRGRRRGDLRRRGRDVCAVGRSGRRFRCTRRSRCGRASG